MYLYNVDIHILSLYGGYLVAFIMYLQAICLTTHPPIHFSFRPLPKFGPWLRLGGAWTEFFGGPRPTNCPVASTPLRNAPWRSAPLCGHSRAIPLQPHLRPLILHLQAILQRFSKTHRCPYSPSQRNPQKTCSFEQKLGPWGYHSPLTNRIYKKSELPEMLRSPK